MSSSSIQIRFAAILIAVATTIPIIYILTLGFQLPIDQISYLWSLDTFWLAIRTIGLAAAVSSTTIVIGVTLAWLTTRTDMPGKGIWSVVLPLPMALPSYLAAYTWIALFAAGGFFDEMLGWSPVSAYGFLGSWLSLSLMTYPYVFLPTYAALLRIDDQLEEAARTLGCSAWQARRKVVWPLIKPSVLSGALLVFLYTLSDFGAVSLLRYDTFTRVLYIQFESTIDRSTTAGLTIVFLGIVLMATSVFWFQPQKQVSLVSSTKITANVTSLGYMKFVALLIPSFTICMALAAPTLTILYWSYTASNIWTWSVLYSWSFDSYRSISVAVASAFGAMLAAMPVSWWYSRTQKNWSKYIFMLSHTSYTVPGIVLALSMVFVSVRLVPWLYQTWLLLVITYVLRFVPQAIAAQNAVMARVQSTVLQAARTLGANTFRTLTQVLLPMIQPGLLGGFSFVFLTAMKELPCALLLAPLDFTTLATEVWSNASEAAFAEAAPGALLLLIISCGSMISQHRTT